MVPVSTIPPWQGQGENSELALCVLGDGRIKRIQIDFPIVSRRTLRQVQRLITVASGSAFAKPGQTERPSRLRRSRRDIDVYSENLQLPRQYWPIAERLCQPFAR
jgi:hypothetical protein